MTTWNYRVFQVKKADENLYYEIRETFYDENVPGSTTASGCYPYGESLEELQDDLAKMAEALKRPVLAWDGEKIIEVSVPTDRLNLEWIDDGEEVKE